MSENPGGQPAANHDANNPATNATNNSTNNDAEFELLSQAPSAPDITGQLKPARSGGAGIPKVTLGLIGAVLLAGGFVGGIAVGKSNASSSSSSKPSNTAAGGARTRGGYRLGAHGSPASPGSGQSPVRLVLDELLDHAAQLGDVDVARLCDGDAMSSRIPRQSSHDLSVQIPQHAARPDLPILCHRQS